MGGGDKTNKQTRIASLQIQSSAYGIAVPWGAGRKRLSFNLGFAAGFESVPVKKQQSGGKGGGSVTTVSYNYFADIGFFICDTQTGPIRGINAIYRDKDVYSGPTCLTDAGFAFLAKGESGQAPWDYLTETYPTQALGYDTTAALWASHYQLNDQAGLQNHSGEIDFWNQVGGGIVDANAGDYGSQIGFLREFLTSQVPQWTAAFIGDLSNFGLHCLAMNLLLSPCLDQQTQASSFIDEVMLETNSEFWIRGDGTAQVTPRTDAAATGNGVTWTPDLTPQYDLTDADFIVDNPTDDALKIDTENLGDIYNQCQITYSNRQHQYDDETIGRSDLASVTAYGARKRDADSCPNVADPNVAALVLQLILQRYANLARPFVFSLPPIFARLELMDLVTVTDPKQGLSRVLARIIQIDRDPTTRKRTYRAEEVLGGVASAPVYPVQGSEGDATDFQADPGDVSPPLMFVMPKSLTNGAYEVGLAVGSPNPAWGGCYVYASLSSTGFQLVGKVSGGANYGVTANDFPSHTDPDNDDGLTVDLSQSAGILADATDADADALTTLSWIGGELIAYSRSSLVGTNTYQLYEHIRRGAYNSIINDHPAGTPFAKLDDSIFTVPFQQGQVGQTVHVKLLSFNIYGKSVQQLEDVPEYTLLLEEPGQLPGAIAGLSLQSPWAGLQFTVVASVSEGADNYTFAVSLLDGTLVHTSAPTPSQSFTYTQDMAIADGHVARSYSIVATPSNSSGNGAPSPALIVNNPAPAAVTGVGKTGSGGSVTINWTANSESDLSGYIGLYSNTPGFDPTSGGIVFYQGDKSLGTSAPLSGLTPSTTYYVRIAAFDTWSDDRTQLNFSEEFSFTA